MNFHRTTIFSKEFLKIELKAIPVTSLGGL
jgi:hypothetical protein